MVGLSDGEKKFDDMFSRFDRNSGRRVTDGRTDIFRRHSPRYA